MIKKTTISDIAKEVGVSKTTISRYLNGNFEYMSAETKQKIETVIKERGYIPNSAARTLKSKKSGLIGVIVHTLRYQVAAKTVQGIHQVCAENGYGTVVCSSDDDPEMERQAIQRCLNQQVDGLVIVPSQESADRYLELCGQGLPVVLCTRRIENWPYGGVYVKHNDLIVRLLDHLKEQGFEKARFLLDVDNFHKRQMGKAFSRRAQELFGMDTEESVVLVGQGSPEAPRELERFLGEYPDRKKAIVAVNTYTLFLTLKTLEQKHIRIPEELGVCGYDAVGWSELVPPGITALYQPMEQMGLCAGKKVMNCLKNGISAERQTALDGTLFIRQSTKLKQ